MAGQSFSRCCSRTKRCCFGSVQYCILLSDVSFMVLLFGPFNVSTGTVVPDPFHFFAEEMNLTATVLNGRSNMHFAVCLLLHVA